MDSTHSGLNKAEGDKYVMENRGRKILLPQKLEETRNRCLCRVAGVGSTQTPWFLPLGSDSHFQNIR